MDGVSAPEVAMPRMPDVALTAVSGRRRWTIDLAQEIERRGFGGVYCASFGDGIALCEAVALATTTLRMGTSIANIYTRHPFDYAQTASFLHEVSDGRFTFGVGVSHGPTHERLGTKVGKPLTDMRRFVEQVRAAEPQVGPLPPIVLATLRDRMVKLASEIGQGAVWANAARSFMAHSLALLTPEQRAGGFYVGNMLPTCIDDDRDAAANVMRRGLIGYVSLPNYRNYWIEAGYEEEMRAIEVALAGGERERVPALMTERWLSDVTLYGSVREVREGIEAWHAAGLTSVILVPSSTRGGQVKAFEELFEALG
jgi:alkanesulfonate monooxygenase SsuD/methylene tetrahydromethanopterin reductase-like flavin-dependent oxidoreductase (luciferase family)